MALPEHVRNWFIPLSETRKTLRQAAQEMRSVALQQGEVPLIVQIAENPRYEIPGLEIFSGATDLQTHDYIHILLGRGLMQKDEAFVLGFTMGSTKSLGPVEEKIYGIFSRYLYPEEYRFSKEDFQVYKQAVRLGYISDCEPLHKVDYQSLLDLSLGEARQRIGLETDLLLAYYRIELRRYPQAFECRRLLTGFPESELAQADH